MKLNMACKSLGIVNKINLSSKFSLRNPIQDADIDSAHEFVFADDLLIKNFHLQFLLSYNVEFNVLVKHRFLPTLRDRCRSILPLAHSDLDVWIRLAEGTPSRP